MIRALLVALLLGSPALAQQEAVSPGTGAVLRGLDRLSGTVSDLELPNGARSVFGRLDVGVEDCRYPTGNPAGDAYAHVTIRDTVTGDMLFAGWMIAASPALNALDHPRYDVWVLRCIIS